MQPLNWKVMTWSLGLFGAVTFVVCVVYGLVVPAVLEGRLSLAQGLAEYRGRVLAYRWAYRRLRWAQWAVQQVPRRWLGGMAEIARRTQRRWWPQYAHFGGLQERRAQRIEVT